MKTDTRKVLRKAPHPSRVSDHAPMMRSLVRRYQLDRVELVCGGADIIARAYPSRHGSLVRQRYERSIAAATGAVSARRGEFQIAELTEMREKAAEGQVAHATGKTILAALTALETALSTNPEVSRSQTE
jgi:hypothetical protein